MTEMMTAAALKSLFDTQATFALIDVRDRRVGVIVSGANIDRARLKSLL